MIINRKADLFDLQDFIINFTSNYEKIIMFLMINGYSIIEIADHTGKNYNSIKQKIYKIKEKAERYLNLTIDKL
jgi:DNA-directed RNA polymerase specialized sigma24 family protein